MNHISDQLLQFYKAMADANRLRIVGLLAEGELAVEQIAEMLDLRSSTVSHHLSRLLNAGLVSGRPDSYYNTYRLETRVLESMSRRLLARETMQAIRADVDVHAYDRKVLKAFCDSEGRIRRFPAQRKKFEVLLRHVATAFTPGVRYTTEQINEILSFYSDDTATLRRNLIAYGVMEREGGGGRYWLRGSC